MNCTLQMLTYMRELERYYPQLVDLQAIGERTYDGNRIYMLKVQHVFDCFSTRFDASICSDHRL